MNPDFSPLTVGGVGGSGTRIVTQILIDIGYYMGSDLNQSNDNLWFTILLRRPNWYKKMMQGNDFLPSLQALEIFNALMAGCSLNDFQSEFVKSAAKDIAEAPLNSRWSFPEDWVSERLQNMFSINNRNHETKNWGWKEPNSHIFLPQINQFFPNMKYVHVIRNGLDMAYSKNQNQLYNWGFLAGLEPQSEFPVSPEMSLDWWIFANLRAINYGAQNLDKRFLLLSFDELCLRPKKVLKELLDFLEVVIASDRITELSTSIQKPQSLNRYTQFQLTNFREDQIRAVHDLGFIT